MNEWQTEAEIQRPPVEEILRGLEAAYGKRTWQPAHEPLDELILTILSQHTSDTNSERAFHDLRRRFPTWEAARRAPVADVAGAIRSGGLATRKAPHIQAALERILSNSTEAEWSQTLKTLPLAEAKARLMTLPGVGPKTAACVLLFACGRPALPVDTHVHRVAKRLGLIEPGVTAEEAHDQIEGLLNPEDVYSFHLNMIAHGRQVCTARKPRCELCPLRSRCAFAQGKAGSRRNDFLGTTGQPKDNDGN